MHLFATMRTIIAACTCTLLVLLVDGETCVDRDLDAVCPQGWTEAFEGHCQAPLSYSGPCSTLLKFPGDSEHQKVKAAETCGVEWPCTDICEQDFEVLCPLGWKNNGGGLCIAPMAYAGRCPRQARMWGREFKQQFALECNVRWPCHQDCKHEYGMSCPTGWLNVDGLCTAPRSYTGPCVPFADMVGLSEDQKRLFADVCLVQFCEDQPLQKERPCKPPKEQACPNGWIHLGSDIGYCYNPSYRGPCRPLISMSAVQDVGPQAFAEKCAVTFRCGDTELLQTKPTSAHFDMSGPVDSHGRIAGLVEA